MCDLDSIVLDGEDRQQDNVDRYQQPHPGQRCRKSDQNGQGRHGYQAFNGQTE